MKLSGNIEINGLRLFGRHGVMPQERAVGNIFEVTAHLRYPIFEAAATDALGSTLNYAEVVEVIMREMRTPSALLEHVASRIRLALLEAFPLIEGGMIRVAKTAPPIPCQLADVAVRIEW